MTKLLYPVPQSSPITQTFSEHLEYAAAHPEIKYNGGIDWAVPSGTEVVAAMDGSVVAAKNDPDGYGNYVRLIGNDGFTTLYAHLSKIFVKTNQSVKAGQVVGLSGSTGRSTGPHLHFELRDDGKPVDPSPYLTAIEPAEIENEPEVVKVNAPKFPASVTATVVTDDGLNIRVQPNTVCNYNGFLDKGTKVKVFGLITVDGNLWAEIGYGQFCAAHFNGQWYLEFKK